MDVGGVASVGGSSTLSQGPWRAAARLPGDHGYRSGLGTLQATMSAWRALARASGDGVGAGERGRRRRELGEQGGVVSRAA